MFRAIVYEARNIHTYMQQEARRACTSGCTLERVTPENPWIRAKLTNSSEPASNDWNILHIACKLRSIDFADIRGDILSFSFRLAICVLQMLFILYVNAGFL